jgi:Domain of unknown function (DUF4170)
MSNYWVIGGEFTDTTFRKLAPGAAEERLGPFRTYREAYQAWQARARATIDDATVRFRIVDDHGRQVRDRSAAA